MTHPGPTHPGNPRPGGPPPPHPPTRRRLATLAAIAGIFTLITIALCAWDLI